MAIKRTLSSLPTGIPSEELELSKSSEYLGDRLPLISVGTSSSAAVNQKTNILYWSGAKITGEKLGAHSNLSLC